MSDIRKLSALEVTLRAMNNTEEIIRFVAWEDRFTCHVYDDRERIYVEGLLLWTMNSETLLVECETPEGVLSRFIYPIDRVLRLFAIHTPVEKEEERS